ncbi:MAG TPA: M43 family zinc metalloprotease [Bacteroidia bacterium]|nr:M43 family zinc metalloprotease [Bacteroidia bacterium]
MKVKVILTLFLLSECTFCIAQQNTNTLSPSSSHVVNKIDHPFIRCATMDYVKWVEQKDTGFKSKIAAAEQSMKNWEANAITSGYHAEQAAYTVPLVVHVLWDNASQQLSLQQVKTQIKVLNQDYNRLNADTIDTPPPFKAVAASMNITFCLAQVDPNGNPTNGVVYKQVPSNTFYLTDDAMKYPSKGGDTAWDVHKYFNIWVCNLAGGVLGYSVFPFLPLDGRFGSVILYSVFGDSNVMAPYNLGRTTTHEVGHLMDLHHPWGDDFGYCPGAGGDDDSIADTPPEGNNLADGYGDGAGPTFGCPPFPYTDNCSTIYPGIMFQNYMEYTDDACMNLFTHDQALRAFTALNGPLASLLTSNVCTPLGIDELGISREIDIFPNPSTGIINAELKFSKPSKVEMVATTVLGQTIYKWNADNITNETMKMDFSAQPGGIYFLRVSDGNSFVVKKVVLSR